MKGRKKEKGKKKTKCTLAKLLTYKALISTQFMLWKYFSFDFKNQRNIVFDLILLKTSQLKVKVCFKKNNQFQTDENYN